MTAPVVQKGLIFEKIICYGLRMAQKQDQPVQLTIIWTAMIGRLERCHSCNCFTIDAHLQRAPTPPFEVGARQEIKVPEPFSTAFASTAFAFAFAEALKDGLSVMHQRLQLRVVAVGALE